MKITQGDIIFSFSGQWKVAIVLRTNNAGTKVFRKHRNHHIWEILDFSTVYATSQANEII